MRLTKTIALSLFALTIALGRGYAAHSKSDRFAFSDEIVARQQLMRVALGIDEADLIISGVELLNVHTLTWNTDWDIVIKDERIAWTGPSGEWKGRSNETVDAGGYFAVPGFGESHKHIESSHITPEYEASLVIPFGNTWTVEGSHEFSNVSGEHNIEFWLTPRQHGSPLKIFPELGSATPPTPYETGGGYYGYTEVRENIAKDPMVVGLGEVMDWPRVWNTELPGSERIWQVIQATIDAGGVVEGHGSGLVELHDINAFAAAGLESDHEVRLAEEAWRKVNRGIFLQLRHDSLPLVIPHLIAKGIVDWSHLSITTDDRNAAASLELGTTNHNLKVAIQAGVPLEAAYTMVTLYPAKHAGVDHLVGSLTPGKFADVVLLRDLHSVDIAKVYADGKLAAEDGRYLLEVPRIDWPDWARNTIRIDRKLNASDFVIAAPSDRSKASAAVLKPFHFEEDFLVESLPIRDGRVHPDTEKGITKLALIDRYSGSAGISKMFWKSVGPKTPRSALTCSVAHDLHNVWVIGNDDQAMANAVNKLVEMGGGWVLVRDRQVAATVRFEIGGLMSARPPQEVADELNNLFAVADTMEWIGQPGLPKRMIFAFLTCTPWKWVIVAPSAHAPQGLVKVTTGETHPVVW